MRETRASRRGVDIGSSYISQLQIRTVKPADDAIERTPEYEAFMKDLEEFHKSHGTPLTKEPVLGSKKLDLFKIYKMVIEAGGCKKVSEERGWKKITVPFNFPATCTNSAYVMKTVYIKFLEGYEMECHWGKKVPYGGLSVSTTFNVPRNSTIDKGDRAEAKSEDQIFMTRTNGIDIVKGNQSIIPQKRPYNGEQGSNSFPVQSLHPPAYRGPWTEGYYLDGGHHNRMLLSLKSSLPNEVDWAFKRLIMLSHECTDTFHVDKIPGLVDALLTFVAPFFENFTQKFKNGDTSNTLEENVSPIVDPFFDEIAAQKSEERVFQAFLIIRNLSFLEHNMRLMAAYKPLRKYLMEGLRLQSVGHFVELRQYCLEIVENICQYILLKGPQDEHLKVLTELLSSNDKALVVGAIRSITRLASNENNVGALSEIEPSTIRRMAELLLLVEDEELVAVLLDWFYQFSDLNKNMACRIVQCTPGNFVRLMMRFLKWRAEDVVKAAYDDLPNPPQAQLTGPFVNLPEPSRTVEWLKTAFEYVHEENVLQTEVWFAYREQFMHSPMQMMPAAEVIKHVNRAFPNSSALAVQAPDGTARYLIQGIRKRHIPPREPKTPTFTCRWDGCSAPPFPNGDEVYHHIIHQHLAQSQQEETLYDCLWMSCKRFNPGINNRSTLLAHLKMHFPISADKPPQDPTYPVMVKPQPLDQRRNFLTHRTLISSDAEGEAIGIPLTACLILRNMSRTKETLSYFLPYETELSDILACCKPLSKFLAETMSNLRKAEM